MGRGEGKMAGKFIQNHHRQRFNFVSKCKNKRLARSDPLVSLSNPHTQYIECDCVLCGRGIANRHIGLLHHRFQSQIAVQNTADCAKQLIHYCLL